MNERNTAKQAGPDPDGLGGTICVLGASFRTGNLGVNALAESTIKILLLRWPQAEIVLFGSGYRPEDLRVPVGDREITVRTVPVRFCKRLLIPYHFVWFALYGLLARLLPWAGARRRLFAHNPYCRALHEARLVVDITGGDSFSDIYGMRRFTLGFLQKWLVLLYGKSLVMMPQTYGPFTRAMARRLARYILNRARKVYSRDSAGIEYVKDLLGGRNADGKVLFAPDVAFLLDARKPAVLDVDGLDRVRAASSVVVGLNISGLLYYGGYTGGNEFGLTVAYPELVHEVVDFLLQKKDVLVLLVPHVIPTQEYQGDVENDLKACLEVHERSSGRYPQRLFVARRPYDQGQIKYVIGLCDFFIGTRMHSCIAALSQGIPAVGLAYSKKFRGVFESVGVGELALDMRQGGIDEMVAGIERALAARDALAKRLQETIPPVRQQVLSLLENLDS
jgi:colanic acid/amylovoran biosynthesis protein